MLGRATGVTGDTLAIYTDGITESFSEAGEEFGEERLTEALQGYRQLPSLTSVHALMCPTCRASTGAISWQRAWPGSPNA
jgi:serine phosphatase RsbU (regulator of sigma subunit)